MINIILANLLSPILDIPTIYVIVILLCISIAIYYKRTGHDNNIIIYTIGAGLLIYGGAIFFISGGIVLTLTPPIEVNNITINSTAITSIDLSIINYTNCSNSEFVSESRYFHEINISNSNSTSIEQPHSETITTQSESIRKLAGGLFGNAIGLIGIGLALIAMGLSNFDRIDIRKNQEEILAYFQRKEYPFVNKYKSSLDYQDIYTIGKIWLGVGLLFTGLRMLLSSQFFILIPLVGLIIIWIGNQKSNIPSEETQVYPLDGSIQKKQDESNLKNEKTDSEIMNNLIKNWWNNRDHFQKFVIESIIAMVIVGSIACVNFIYCGNITIVNLLLQFTLAILIAIFTVKYTFERNKEKMFHDALQGLLDEMTSNIERVLTSNYNQELDKLPKKQKDGKWIGFDKKPSFTNWVDFNDGNFYLKYLPLSKFFFFFNQGFINNDKYVGDGISAAIMRFYINCSYLNSGIQNIENQMFKDPKRQEKWNLYLQEFWNVRKEYITNNYFSSGLFSEYLGIIENFQNDPQLSKINYPLQNIIEAVREEINEIENSKVHRIEK